MILEKFLIIAFISHLTAAAPADVTEPVDIKSETLTVPTTTTDIPTDTTTGLFGDSRHNEVDAKLPTTTSDIDEKIESIEADSDVRSSSASETISTTEIVHTDKFRESKTEEVDKFFKTAWHDETTISQISAQEPEEIETEVEKVQEPRSDVEFERFVTENGEEENESTTKGLDESALPSSTITSIEATPRLFVTSTDGTISKSMTESYNSSERAQAIDKIRKMMQAHVLRAILTLLSQARKQELEQIEENSQPRDQSVMESQITDESFSVLSEGDYDFSENNGDDEVTTDDDEKVIAFDKKLQRYVYMDKADYEVQHSADYVSF